MRILSPTHLIGVVAGAIALTSPAGYAAPPTAGPEAPPGTGARFFGADAERPLPTLVPPANDDFGSPTIVSGLPFTATQTTTEATGADDDPWPIECLENAVTVWYAYTTPFTTRVTADTFGSDYNTCLSVFTGSRGTLAEVASNDDADPSRPESRLSFLAEGGVAYVLMIGGNPGGGTLHLSIDVDTPLAQIRVRTTRAAESRPSAGPTHLAWAQRSLRARFWTLNVKRQGGARVRANRPRTDGYSGGFEGETFVYQEVRRGQSNLQLLDLGNRRRSAPPAGVNTRHWEWHPTISGDRLLFARHNYATDTDLIILRNLGTGRSTVLDRLATSRRRFAESGQVNGNYAVWYRCTPRCNVFLHDIAAKTTRRIPNPRGWHHYDPSVASDGTVYFWRSGGGCGWDPVLVRRPLAGPERVLARLASGRDSFHTYVLEHGDGRTTVLFDRLRCRTGAWDVLKVVDP